MQSGLAHAGLRIRESLDAHPELAVILDSTGSPSSRLRARFLAQDGDAIKVQLTTALGHNLLVSIAGEIDTGSGREPLLGKYRVASCKIAGIGKYQAELIPEPVAEETSPQQPNRPDDDLDYYQVLQVSRLADTDTIRRIFHVLAQRYHPDNRETGNQDKFRQVVEAHAVLCDPEKRAAHDVLLAGEDKVRFKLFDSLQSTEGVQAEIRKRQGILRLLYAKPIRINRPCAGAISLRCWPALWSTWSSHSGCSASNGSSTAPTVTTLRSHGRASKRSRPNRATTPRNH